MMLREEEGELKWMLWNPAVDQIFRLHVLACALSNAEELPV
jgi:hypothetical protein